MSQFTGFDPVLWMLGQMVAAASQQPSVQPRKRQPPAGATPRERHVYYSVFGSDHDGKTKAQREAEKRAAQLGFGKAGR